VSICRTVTSNSLAARHSTLAMFLLTDDYCSFIVNFWLLKGFSESDPPDVGPWAVDTASVMTRNLARPEEMYLTRLIIDAARAVDAARTFEVADPRRVAEAGISHRPRAGNHHRRPRGRRGRRLRRRPVSVCHIWRGVALSTTGPYTEIRAYLALRPELTDLARATFSYVDALHFAQRANAPALFSVAGHDCVCPRSTVFAVYSHFAGPKGIRVWPFNAHEGGGGFQVAMRIDFLRETSAKSRDPTHTVRTHRVQTIDIADAKPQPKESTRTTTGSQRSNRHPTPSPRPDGGPLRVGRTRRSVRRK